jgi:hypothetical protein
MKLKLVEKMLYYIYILLGFNVSVIKLVFVASTVNLLFNSNSTHPILTLTQIDTTSMRKARQLFEGFVYLSKMGKLGNVPVLRNRRLQCLIIGNISKYSCHFRICFMIFPPLLLLESSRKLLLCYRGLYC